MLHIKENKNRNPETKTKINNHYYLQNLFRFLPVFPLVYLQDQIQDIVLHLLSSFYLHFQVLLPFFSQLRVQAVLFGCRRCNLSLYKKNSLYLSYLFSRHIPKAAKIFFFAQN